MTGSSRGIGAAIAKQLAAEGATVAVNYISVLLILSPLSMPSFFLKIFFTTIIECSGCSRGRGRDHQVWRTGSCLPSRCGRARSGLLSGRPGGQKVGQA